MKVQCPYCKNEPDLAFYYYDTQIRTQSHFPSDVEEYHAIVRAKSICPYCGETIYKVFDNTIFKDVIIKLATNNFKEGDI